MWATRIMAFRVTFRLAPCAAPAVRGVRTAGTYGGGFDPLESSSPELFSLRLSNSGFDAAGGSLASLPSRR